jgi:hypothetical protein
MGMPIETKIQLVQEDMAVTPHLLDETVNTDERTEVKVLLKNKELLNIRKKQLSQIIILQLI